MRPERTTRALIGCVLVVSLVTLRVAETIDAASTQRQAALFAGLGFDTCDAPPLPTLQAWLASPYRALGIYIGGANRACPNAQLSSSWVTSAKALGWSLAPLYVGLQAPCTSLKGAFKIAASVAGAQGVAAADDAIANANALALPANSPIYFDMEGYALDNPSCSQSVLTFLSAWVGELHVHGFLAGVYGSAASTMRDLQGLAATSGTPDDVWIADWNGSTTVFGDPYLADALWPSHQRIHQFSGGHRESYGGVTLDVDSDYLDAAVVGASASAPPAPVPPPPSPTPAPSGLSAAGSVTTSDGTATVSWAAGTFQHSVAVTLIPSLPNPTLPGFGAGGYGVQLTIQQLGSAASTATVVGPLTIHVAPQPAGLAPLFSTNGTVWQGLPELVGNLLPDGLSAGYARQPDGSLEIETRTPGQFALLPYSTPPPAPASLSGHFTYGSLVLRWPASVDAAGAAVAYEVSLSGQPLLSVSGQTEAALRSFHPHAPSVYRVTAIDAAGNRSQPSSALVVLPSERPSAVPRVVPAWAWTLFTWQQQGQVGPRPLAPRPVPAWYWLWRAWRVAPFHLAP